MLTKDETEIKLAISTLRDLMLTKSPNGKFTYEENKELLAYIRGIDSIFSTSVGNRIIKESNKKQ